MDEAARRFGLFIVKAAHDQSGGWERDAEKLAAVLAYMAREASSRDRDRDDWKSRLVRTRAILQGDVSPVVVTAEVDAWAREIRALDQGWGPRQADLLRASEHATNPRLGDLVFALTHLPSNRGPVNQELMDSLRRIGDGPLEETDDSSSQERQLSPRNEPVDPSNQGRPVSPWRGVGSLTRRERPSFFDPEDNTGEAPPEEYATWERSTRNRVVRSILDSGPSTVADLARRLGLTPSSVRRHLDQLVFESVVEASGLDSAQLFALTDYGRDAFEQSNDALAVDARRRIEDSASGERLQNSPFVDMESVSPERILDLVRLLREAHEETEIARRRAMLWDNSWRGEDFPDPPDTFDAEDIAPAVATMNHALAALFLRLGPPPSPTEQDFAPVGSGDGGAQA